MVTTGQIVTRELFEKNMLEKAKNELFRNEIHNLISNDIKWDFDEDNLRVRKKNAGQNMAIIRHVVFNMLGNAKKCFKDVGTKALRKKAAWGYSTLELILRQSF